MRATLVTQAVLAMFLVAPGGVAAAQGEISSGGSAEAHQGKPIRRSGRPVARQYIVVLRDDVRAEDVDGEVEALTSRYQGLALGTWRNALRGFVARMDDAQARALGSDPRVAWVEEDGEVHASATEANAPWDLDRIDQRARPLDGSYAYASDGAGVNVYVIDTGIRTTHHELGGRASEAFTAVSDGHGAGDCNGHGTHVAGTVAGAVSGVAKDARLYSVRVLDCDGSGTVSAAISGVDWVTAHHVAPAVANMSLGGAASSALDLAVQGSMDAGVVYVVAAGNEARDACATSPARVPGALTVAASDGSDAQASFSNFGPCVDLFAPGVNITSAWATDDDAMKTLSGTSMAAPHVTGTVAQYLSVNSAATPAQVADALVSNATTGALSSLGDGTADRLLYEAFIEPSAPPPVCSTSTQLLGNPGFETGTAAPWTASPGVIDGSAAPGAHSGAWKAWLCGYATAHTDDLVQTVTIPADACDARLGFWLWILSVDSLNVAVDKLSVTVSDPAGQVLATLAAFSNRDRSSGYVLKTYDLSAFKGRTIRLSFHATENGSRATSFIIDDATLTVLR